MNDTNRTLKASEIYFFNNVNSPLRDIEFTMTDKFLIVDEGGVGVNFYNLSAVRKIIGVHPVDLDKKESHTKEFYPFWNF